MELWQAVTAVSGAVVALVVVGSAAIGLISRPVAKLRKEFRADLRDVRTEGSEAHNAIGGNIRELGQELKALINASTEKVEGKVDKVEGKVDKLSEDLTVVREKVSHIDGGMPYIRDRLGKLEG